MKKHGRGLSLNGFSLCYGLVTPAERAGLKIDFRVASVDSLPFPDGSFDVATSTMMFHHLPVQIKERGFPHLLPHRQDVAFFVQAVALNLYNTQNVEPLTL